MVTITPEAAQVLAQAAEQHQMSEGQVLKLVPVEEGLGLEPAIPNKADHVLWHEETAVLAVPPDVEARLGDAVIELRETDQGAGLAIRPS